MLIFTFKSFNEFCCGLKKQLASEKNKMNKLRNDKK